MNELRPWIIVGNPENRRIALFQEALARYGLPAASVLSYYGLLTGQETIESIPDNAIVRIESPGENFAVEKLLLKAGVEAALREGSPVAMRDQVEALEEDRGLIFHPRQWYLGFISSWAKWFQTIRLRKASTTTTTARDLEVVFDKPLCHAACHGAGLPVPAALPRVQCFEELIQRLRDFGFQRVFIKLANGSTASGVVALHATDRSMEAITSVELVRTGGAVRLYNSLKIRRYTSLDDVRDLVDALTPHHVHVEQWLPKASLGRRVCDMRIVVVDGEPQHTVVRTSRSPITNLHLGNRRGDLSEVLRKISQQGQEDLHKTCLQCATLFPDTFQLALDVLFTPGFRRHYLLEVNAFGDLLPGAEYRRRNTYESQIEALIVMRNRQSPAKVIGPGP